jgi:hypothetical protein
VTEFDGQVFELLLVVYRGDQQKTVASSMHFDELVWFEDWIFLHINHYISYDNNIYITTNDGNKF